MTTEVEHVASNVYIVRVTTEFHDDGRPRRHAWVVSQFGPQALLLRISVNLPKRTALAWARAWAAQPTPAEPLGAIDNRIPAGV